MGHVMDNVYVTAQKKISQVQVMMGFWSKKMNFKSGVQRLQVIEELETFKLNAVLSRSIILKS